MKVKTASRYAVFLILLVLGQEFCVARYASPGSQSLKVQRIEKREAKEESHELQGKSRQRRVAYAVVLLAVAFTTSVLTVSFEIYSQIKGCCGMFPDACTYAKEVDRLRKQWQQKTKEIDALFLKVTNLKEDVIQHNFKINEMWIDLQAISSNYRDTINMLSPNTTKKFKQKWKEIKQELIKGNTTVSKWSYEEINLQFKSYFRSPHNALYGLSTFLSNSISVAYEMSKNSYRNSYQAKMINQLGTGESYKQLVNAKNTKAATIMGMDDISVDQYVKDTAQGRVDGKFGSSKYSYLIHAYNVIGTAMSLGSDIYRIYSNVKQCKEQRDSAKDIYDHWTKADDEMNDVKTYATNYFDTLTKEGWGYVKGNLSDPNLLKTLESIKELSKTASPQTARLQRATKHIDDYMAHIKTTLDTNPDKAYTLESNLIDGLMTAKFLTQCYNTRIMFVQFVSGQCKKGANKLQDLYNWGKQQFQDPKRNCMSEVGVAEISLQNMEKVIADRSSIEKYQADCILNNDDKVKEACRHKYDGYSDSQIAGKMKLTVDQIQILTKSCPQPKLTPLEKQNICVLRKSEGFSNAYIQKHLFPHHDLDTIKDVKCS